MRQVASVGAGLCAVVLLFGCSANPPPATSTPPDVSAAPASPSASPAATTAPPTSSPTPTPATPSPAPTPTPLAVCELLPDADLRDAVAPLADGVISVGGAPASCSYESDDQLTDMVVRIEHGYSAVPLARELCASGAAVADVGEDAWWCPETGVLAVAADGYSIEVQIASLRMDAEGLLPTSETLSAVAAEVASIALAEIPDDSTGDGGCTALDTDDVAEALGAEFRTGMAPAGSGADEACSFERADTFGVLTVLVYAGADRYDDLASQMESAQPVPGFDRAALDEEGSALAVACDDHAVLLHWFELETDPGAGERLVDLATTTCANMS